MMAEAPLGAPEPLAEDHVLDGFTCGAPTLDHWLARKARANQASRTSRTYVLCRGRQVVGYYALAAGSVSHSLAPGGIRRNMPDPSPVIVLGRLAIATGEQGRGLGHALLRDAVLRSATAAREVCITAILVHALEARARAFYLGSGFVESALDPMILMLRMKDVRALLDQG